MSKLCKLRGSVAFCTIFAKNNNEHNSDGNFGIYFMGNVGQLSQARVSASSADLKLRQTLFNLIKYRLPHSAALLKIDIIYDHFQTTPPSIFRNDYILSIGRRSPRKEPEIKKNLNLIGIVASSVSR